MNKMAITFIQEFYSQLHVGTVGGLFFYVTAFVVVFVPLAIIFFESKASKPQKSSETRYTWGPNYAHETKITQILVYPIKSCRGINVKKTKLLRAGLDLDRNWMFVDANMKFLTIRENAKMTLINISITDDGELVADATSIDPAATFRIPARPTQQWLEENTELKRVQIWRVNTDAWIYPPELTAGFRVIFGHDVRLARKGPEPRLLSGNAAAHRLGRTESARFSDVTPLMVSNQKSIVELNSRLGVELTIERFRPNIIVDGEVPWCEDRWKTLRFGDELAIDVTSRCGRCRVTIFHAFSNLV
jgi:hypothetical protein